MGVALHAPVDGVLLLDKPVGPSSNAVLQRAKRLLGAARAGHAGTLDPLASGLLVVSFGEATKFSGELLDSGKAYRARVKLGERTATGDAEGPVLARCEVRIGRDELLAVLEHFRGEIEQVPPMYAAIKHRGRPLYAYARKGERVRRAPRQVAVQRLEEEAVDGDTDTLDVECSKGTHIRGLADDVGASLGCGAHLTALERTAVGPFKLRQAIPLEALESLLPAERRGRLLPPEVLLGKRPRLVLRAEPAAKFRQGRAVAVGSPRGSVGVFREDGRFLGIGDVDASGVLQPKRLVVQR